MTAQDRLIPAPDSPVPTWTQADWMEVLNALSAPTVPDMQAHRDKLRDDVWRHLGVDPAFAARMRG